MKILLIILLTFFFILFNKKQIEKFIQEPKICLLIRSYNRPEYLQKTINSILKSDYKMCKKCIIYDDGSSDNETKKILEKYEKDFIVIKNKNKGIKHSFIDALRFIKNNTNCDYICTIDNDCLVNKDFIKKLYNTYKKIKLENKLKYILLTGFNCTHNGKNSCIHKIVNMKNGYAEKTSCGGINLFFHKNLINNIIIWWNKNLDWGIVRELKKNNGKIFTTIPSVVQHIGTNGTWSKNDKYDFASDFIS